MKKREKEAQLTLADHALRETFRKRPEGPTVAIELRPLLTQARRFILDARASTFLHDLSYVNFRDMSPARARRAMETTRILARLPHKVCWFEYDSVALYEYAASLGYRVHHVSGLNPLKSGLLCRSADWSNEVFRCTMIHQFDDRGEVHLYQQPIDLCWITAAGQEPHIEKSDNEASQAIHEILEDMLGFKTQQCSFLDNAMTNEWLGRIEREERSSEKIEATLRTYGSEFRRLLTLLACINDIPLGVREVKATHGFVAAGRYRKFLDHSVITLNLPKGRDPRKVARALIAHIRRRAHEVRGHWRRDYRHPGERIWIPEHQRGDASLGFVTHDYKVEHETP